MEPYAGTKNGRKIVLATLLINFMFVLIAIVVGKIYGSSALIAGGFYSAAYIPVTASTLRRLTGGDNANQRSRPVVLLCAAFLFFCTGLMLTASAVAYLGGGDRVTPGFPALLTGLLCIPGRELMYRYTLHMGNRLKDHAFIATARYHRAGSLLSVAVLLCLAGARAGYPVLDLMAGLVISVFILQMAVGMAWESLSVLAGGIPPGSKKIPTAAPLHGNQKDQYQISIFHR